MQSKLLRQPRVLGLQYLNIGPHPPSEVINLRLLFGDLAPRLVALALHLDHRLLGRDLMAAGPLGDFEDGQEFGAVTIGKAGSRGEGVDNLPHRDSLG